MMKDMHIIWSFYKWDAKIWKEQYYEAYFHKILEKNNPDSQIMIREAKRLATPNTDSRECEVQEQNIGATGEWF